MSNLCIKLTKSSTCDPIFGKLGAQIDAIPKLIDGGVIRLGISSAVYPSSDTDRIMGSSGPYRVICNRYDEKFQPLLKDEGISRKPENTRTNQKARKPQKHLEREQPSGKTDGSTSCKETAPGPSKDQQNKVANATSSPSTPGEKRKKLKRIR
ncbi:hypothetical protein J6590_092473 [Homalodisca vitripennis]|nr:hypothetical protein J6590_092473 [Homalodisca vitripennis]